MFFCTVMETHYFFVMLFQSNAILKKLKEDEEKRKQEGMFHVD